MTRKGICPLILLLLFLVAGMSTSCGYQLAANADSVVGDGTKTMKVKGVDYPTLQPWLPYIIRSSLRDEINARYLAQWVDSGPADYEIQINVKSYTSREWMRSYSDQTLLFDSTISLEAIIYKGDTNTEVWRSGILAYSERLETPGERPAAGGIITQIMRQLTDKMRNTF